MSVELCAIGVTDDISVDIEGMVVDCVETSEVTTNDILPDVLRTSEVTANAMSLDVSASEVTANAMSLDVSASEVTTNEMSLDVSASEVTTNEMSPSSCVLRTSASNEIALDDVDRSVIWTGLLDNCEIDELAVDEGGTVVEVKEGDTGFPQLTSISLVLDVDVKCSTV